MKELQVAKREETHRRREETLRESPHEGGSVEHISPWTLIAPFVTRVSGIVRTAVLRSMVSLISSQNLRASQML